MDDKLYFSNEQMLFAQMELQMRILAQLELLVALRVLPSAFKTTEDIVRFADNSRSNILTKLYEDFGFTPPLDT